MNKLSTTSLTYQVSVNNSVSSSVSKFENDNNLMINIYALTNKEHQDSPIATIRMSNRIKEMYNNIISQYNQQT